MKLTKKELKALCAPDIGYSFRCDEYANELFKFCEAFIEGNQFHLVEKLRKLPGSSISKINTKNGTVENRRIKKNEFFNTQRYHKNETALQAAMAISLHDYNYLKGLTFDSRTRDWYDDNCTRDGGADVVLTEIGHKYPSLMLDAKLGSSFNNLHVEWNFKNKPILIRALLDEADVARNVGKFTYWDDMKKGVGRVSYRRLFKNIAYITTNSKSLSEADAYIDMKIDMLRDFVEKE